MNKKIGVIGLGHMGLAVARKLSATGHKLILYNRTPDKAKSLIQMGAELCKTPLELAERAEIIFTLVADDKAMESLSSGFDGFVAGMAPDKLLIEMSTLSEEMISNLGSRIKEHGGKMLHAPILGGPMNIFVGNATICVGGAKAVVQSSLPLLESISKPVHFVGELTKATLTKMSLNIMMAHLHFGITSSLVFADKARLNKKLVLDTLANVSNGVIGRIGEKMISEEKGVTFSIKNLEKDLRYFRDKAAAFGLELPTINAAHGLATYAKDKGLEDADFTSLYELLLSKTGN